jgi:hypothetical protein
MLPRAWFSRGAASLASSRPRGAASPCWRRPCWRLVGALLAPCWRLAWRLALHCLAPCWQACVCAWRKVLLVGVFEASKWRTNQRRLVGASLATRDVDFVWKLLFVFVGQFGGFGSDLVQCRQVCDSLVSEGMQK